MQPAQPSKRPAHRHAHQAAHCIRALLLGLWVPLGAEAQPIPNAGSTLRETQPPLREAAPPSPLPAAPAELQPTPAPPSPSFVLKSVRFAGVTLFPEAEFQALATARMGKPTTLADLERIAEQVTERYRAAGFLLAQAIVPAQDVTAGNVEISVLEGIIGAVKVEVDPAAPIAPAQVRAFAARVHPGRALQQEELTRTMLLLSDLPGITAQADLESGDTPGATDLTINIRPAPRWDVSFYADNYGAQSVAEYQAGVQARWNSPTGIGDNLDVRLQLGAGGGLTFGRLGYERPIGPNGHRVSLAYYHLQYALGHEFVALDATGIADVVDFTWSYPFIRSRSRNLVGRAVLQYEKLQDRYGAFSLVDDRSITSTSFGLAYENSDRLLGGGYTSASLSALVGNLVLDSPRQRDDDDHALRTHGVFARWNYAASRLNTLTSRLNLYVGVAGQLASKNLDSAMKTALGGPRGVRAYAPTEATADEAQVVNAELRYSPTQDVSLQAFYDWGWARIHDDPPGNGSLNSVRLRGYGVGVFWGAGGRFTLRASLAWPATGPGSVEPIRNPRLYVQVAQSL